MIYNEYGRTGVMVSTVGFGGMQFDISRPNAENAELLLYAHEKGINYFDTAMGYCNNKSEEIFGIAFKQMTGLRDDFYVSTKAMPTEFDTADKATAAVEKSLKRLKVDKIDFFHVWCIRKMAQYELAMKPGGMYEGLLKCKEQGMIDHIVVSTHLQGRQVRQIVEDGKFEGVLLGVNILNFMYRWEAVQAAWEAGWGVVAMNPLLGGVIPKHEKSLSFLAGDGETPTEAALRFCISCPQITITLNGFTTKEHIDMACRIADDSRPFTQADIERVKEHISGNMDSLCTGCGYCVGVCPENIAVANYMQFYNDKPLCGKTDEQMTDAIKFSYEWGILADLAAQAGDCTECGKCQDACTQHLNIIERLAEIAGWEEKAKPAKK